MRERGAQHRRDLTHVVKREGQLDLLSYLIIISLIAMVAVLLLLMLTDAAAPEMWLFRSHAFRVLAAGFFLGLLIYLFDQHNRLRSEIVAMHRHLEQAKVEVEAANKHLAFAHRAAVLMSSLSRDDGLDTVLQEAAEHFGADAVAVVEDDVRMFATEATDTRAAEAAAMQVALDAVAAGRPITVADADPTGSAIAVPLRVSGRLDSVACAWRAEGTFAEEQLSGLQLVARIIEMSIENRRLLEDANARVQGTLHTLAALVDMRQPEYSHHSARVADYALGVGRIIGLPDDELEDLRVAALLHDVGMLEVPKEILAATRPLTAAETFVVRRHPAAGAEIVRAGGFGHRVQEAVLRHHERLDGSGYPEGLRGPQIPLVARIIAACDAFAAMTTPRPHRDALSRDEAVAELVHETGTGFDRTVVQALISLVSGQARPSRRGKDVSALLSQVS
ncbi:MAG: HD domain-containing protein [Aeromicrobium sp.]|nr:HD domain-containing protein [Aeromicrobium sp.]